MTSRPALPTAYVLGMSPNGLAIARDLGRQGVPVVCLEENASAPALKTRYATVCLMPPLKLNPGAWVDALVVMGRRRPERGVVFPAGDAYALLLSDHRARLEPYFSLVIPSDEIVHTLPDKRRFHELAQRLGVRVAQTCFPRTLEELEWLNGAVQYPCALKPVHSHEWAREPRNPHRAKKMLPVTNERELRERFRELQGYGLEMMIQELIPGDMTRLYGLVAHFDRCGEPRGWYLMRKVRQFPVDFGLAALAVTTEEPGASEAGLGFLKAIGYRGIGHVELKRDARDEGWVVIEANTRPVLFNSLGSAAGVNLPYEAYCDAAGLPMPRTSRHRAGVKWIDFQADVQSYLTLRHERRLSAWRWAWSLLAGKKAYAFFAWDDLRPWWAATRTFLWRFRHCQYEVQQRRVVPFTW
jgi:predicted ATP-grasp superfamily ATP-dependent carboligase